MARRLFAPEVKHMPKDYRHKIKMAILVILSFAALC